MLKLLRSAIALTLLTPFAPATAASYRYLLADQDVPIDAAGLAAELRSGRAVRLIDVRTAEEHRRRRIAGAESLPLVELEELLSGPLILHCERDPRSIRAAMLIAEAGLAADLADAPEVRYLRGGIQALAEVAPELVEEEGAP